VVSGSPPLPSCNPPAESVAESVASLRQRIARAGGGRPVEIVAVTKGFGVEMVAAVATAGVLDVGENYAQEMLAKVPGAPAEVRWHFLGPIQTNKVSRLSRVVHRWHGVDRPVAGDTIARHQPGAGVFVQVNLTGEPSKHGCRPPVTAALVEHLKERGLDVRGLMTIGPQGDRRASRAAFRRLAAMANQLALPELSMGMSEDFEIAVEEGATTVRLGRALFGPRPGAGPARR
jgi:pyridoxal phosphate enzyme (YggS family)